MDYASRVESLKLWSWLIVLSKVEIYQISSLSTFLSMVFVLKVRVSESMALIDRMMDNGCQPDEATYGLVTNRMCKSGNTARPWICSGRWKIERSSLK
uniref:Pentatricopeptide repeat-containing protein n=1 Tax=Brassica oleracea var. oleracea TaxID=109376 RepID=A0A0D3DY07_BRAOL